MPGVTQAGSGKENPAPIPGLGQAPKRCQDQGQSPYGGGHVRDIEDLESSRSRGGPCSHRKVQVSFLTEPGCGGSASELTWARAQEWLP